MTSELGPLLEIEEPFVLVEQEIPQLESWRWRVSQEGPLSE